MVHFALEILLKQGVKEKNVNVMIKVCWAIVSLACNLDTIPD